MAGLAFAMVGAGVLIWSAGLFGHLRRPRPDTPAPRPHGRGSRRVAMALLTIAGVLLLIAVSSAALS